MSSTPVNQQERDALRETFGKKADSILEGLKSKSKGSYDRADLRELGVSLHRVDITEGFGPTGQKFPDFKPLSEREFRSYKIESADLPEHIREHYDGFDDAFRYSPEYSLPESDRNYEKAFQISRYIKILYNYSKKRTLTMSDHSKWYEIMAEDSFQNGPQGMLSGLRIGHSKPCDLPEWDALSWRQWQENSKKPDTIRPHIMLVICTGAVAQEDELLHGEIGPIVNAIQCRLFQEEFKHTSSFPVLVISLFGPRKGRILHGRFDPSSSDLIVRASPIFNFEKRNKEGFDLFMRYYDCEPQDVVEFESIATGEKSRSPTTTHGRTSPSGIGDETSITSQEPDSEIFARRT